MKSGTAASLAELVATLKDLQAQVANAEAATATARTHENTCRCRLSDVQKEIDATVADLKKGAPRDTVWGQARSQREQNP